MLISSITNWTKKLLKLEFITKVILRHKGSTDPHLLLISLLADALEASFDESLLQEWDRPAPRQRTNGLHEWYVNHLSRVIYYIWMIYIIQCYIWYILNFKDCIMHKTSNSTQRDQQRSRGFKPSFSEVLKPPDFCWEFWPIFPWPSRNRQTLGSICLVHQSSMLSLVPPVPWRSHPA